MSDEMKSTPAEEEVRTDAPVEPAPEVSAEPVAESEAAPSEPVAPPPPPDPSAAPDPSTLPDTTVINRFRVSAADAYLRLNRDFGLRMTAEGFDYLQKYYQNVARRDPSLGELRMLDTLSHMPVIGRVGAESCVGEFITESGTLAETWADMMLKHATLARAADGTVSPCTWEDCLLLTTRYLLRMGWIDEPKKLRRHQSRVDRAVLLSQVQELEAIAAGFRIEHRLLTADGRRVAIGRRVGNGLHESQPHTGDMILYCPAVQAGTLAAVVEAQRHMATPDIGALRVLTRKSLLATARELAVGLDLCVYRLWPEDQISVKAKLPVEKLCGTPVVSGNTCDVLLRAPVKRTYYLVEELRRRGITAVVLGQVVPGERTVLRTRDIARSADIVAATLPTALLRDMEAVAAHTCYPALREDVTASVACPSMARLPGLSPAEDGLTPLGWETVALTAAPDAALTVPEEELTLSAASAEITVSGTGYRAAMEAVITAAEAVRERVSPAARRALSLTVSLTVRGTPASLTAETVCGLYRAAAERGLPVRDPYFTAETGEGESVTLTVIAWVSAPQGKFIRPDVADDRQWSTPVRPAANAPALIFPTLRRSMEGSLNALIHALNRREGAVGTIRPVIIDRVEVPASPSAELAGENAPAETREVLNSDSVTALVGQLEGAVTPVFALNDKDARLLLDDQRVREVLDRRLAGDGRILVLGEAVSAFAACGYLPEGLSTLTAAAYTGPARADYIGVSFSPSAIRLVRRTLLVPAETDAPHLLTLTLPDGTVVPDGFVGHDGRVCGLLNGVDALVEPLLRAPIVLAEKSNA